MRGKGLGWIDELEAGEPGLFKDENDEEVAGVAFDDPSLEQQLGDSDTNGMSSIIEVEETLKKAREPRTPRNRVAAVSEKDLASVTPRDGVAVPEEPSGLLPADKMSAATKQVEAIDTGKFTVIELMRQLKNMFSEIKGEDFTAERITERLQILLIHASKSKELLAEVLEAFGHVNTIIQLSKNPEELETLREAFARVSKDPLANGSEWAEGVPNDATFLWSTIIGKIGAFDSAFKLRIATIPHLGRNFRDSESNAFRNELLNAAPLKNPRRKLEIGVEARLRDLYAEYINEEGMDGVRSYEDVERCFEEDTGFVLSKKHPGMSMDEMKEALDVKVQMLVGEMVYAMEINDANDAYTKCLREIAIDKIHSDNYQKALHVWRIARIRHLDDNIDQLRYKWVHTYDEAVKAQLARQMKDIVAYFNNNDLRADAKILVLDMLKEMENGGVDVDEMRASLVEDEKDKDEAPRVSRAKAKLQLALLAVAEVHNDPTVAGDKKAKIFRDQLSNVDAKIDSAGEAIFEALSAGVSYAFIQECLHNIRYGQVFLPIEKAQEFFERQSLELGESINTLFLKKLTSIKVKLDLEQWDGITKYLIADAYEYMERYEVNDEGRLRLREILTESVDSMAKMYPAFVNSLIDEVGRHDEDLARDLDLRSREDGVLKKLWRNNWTRRGGIAAAAVGALWLVSDKLTAGYDYMFGAEADKGAVEAGVLDDAAMQAAHEVSDEAEKERALALEEEAGIAAAEAVAEKAAAEEEEEARVVAEAAEAERLAGFVGAGILGAAADGAVGVETMATSRVVNLGHLGDIEFPIRAEAGKGPWSREIGAGDTTKMDGVITEWASHVDLGALRAKYSFLFKDMHNKEFRPAMRMLSNYKRRHYAVIDNDHGYGDKWNDVSLTDMVFTFYKIESHKDRKVVMAALESGEINIYDVLDMVERGEIKFKENRKYRKAKKKYDTAYNAWKAERGLAAVEADRKIVQTVVDEDADIIPIDVDTSEIDAEWLAMAEDDDLGLEAAVDSEEEGERVGDDLVLHYDEDGAPVVGLASFGDGGGADGAGGAGFEEFDFDEDFDDAEFDAQWGDTMVENARVKMEEKVAEMVENAKFNAAWDKTMAFNQEEFRRANALMIGQIVSDDMLERNVDNAFDEIFAREDEGNSEA